MFLAAILVLKSAGGCSRIAIVIIILISTGRWRTKCNHCW